MANTGMDIFKMLPKTNCRECGLPTCIAFAMSLAASKIDDSACPYLSDQNRSLLVKTDAPPIKVITIGDNKEPFTTGGDTKLFRHEKAFPNPPGVAMTIPDNADSAEIDARLMRFETLRYKRMGQCLRPDLVAIKSVSGSGTAFCNLIRKVMSRSDANLILLSEDTGLLEEGLPFCKDRKPLLHAATTKNVEKICALASNHHCPVTAKAESLEALQQLSTQLTNIGIEMILLDPGSRTLKQTLTDHVAIRRAAIHQRFKPFGFPTIAFPSEMTNDLAMETMIGAMFIARNTGIIVLSDIQPESLFPLLLQRMELYSDPEEPRRVPPGLYEINNPDPNSPVSPRLLLGTDILWPHSRARGMQNPGLSLFRGNR